MAARTSSVVKGPLERLHNLLERPDNKFCADCGTPDPRWASFNLGVFICIQCSGIHRSLGVHLSKVLSVNLDAWTDEQVDALVDGGGNSAVNMRYEAFLPKDFRKPGPDSAREERSDFIRRKYEGLQFISPSSNQGSSEGKAKQEKHHSVVDQPLCHSLRRKETKSISNKGMVEFLGLLQVHVIRGYNLAVRDVRSSDPYVVLTLGDQSAKTKVVRRSLNPVWNESLMLSIPNPTPALKLEVYDKDKFSKDDKMGNAEIEITPLSQRQERMTIPLKNVECGEIEIELQFMPLPQ